MKYVIIGHPIQINVSHIQPFVYVAWQRLLVQLLFMASNYLENEIEKNVITFYSRNEYSNHVTQRIRLDALPTMNLQTSQYTDIIFSNCLLKSRNYKTLNLRPSSVCDTIYMGR